MSVCSGEVSTSLDGKTLTFLDTGTYGTVTSRILNILDVYGNVLTQINMGASLTATYAITADAMLQFILNVNDGAAETCTVNYLAQGIYAATYLNIIKLVGCSCNCSNETYQELSVAELFLAAANRFALGTFSVYAISANNNIIAANNMLTP